MIDCFTFCVMERVYLLYNRSRSTMGSFQWKLNPTSLIFGVRQGLADLYKTEVRISYVSGILKLGLFCFEDVGIYVSRANEDGEVFMKTLTDCWVVGRKSDQRELYVILHQKNANLIDVNGALTVKQSGRKGIALRADDTIVSFQRK